MSLNHANMWSRTLSAPWETAPLAEHTLMPYQEEGAQWLAPRARGVLADEMGMGKSCQALTAARLVKARTILIVCPAVMVPVWRDEITKFYPGLSSKMATFRSGGTWVQKVAEGVVICSYDATLTNTDRAYLKAVDWDVIICDEGHYLKNPQAKRTKAIYSKGGLQAVARRLWVLTGTPMPNYPIELWTHLTACGVNQYKYREFLTRFCTYNPQWMTVTGAKTKAMPELKAMLAQCMLRRTKKMVKLDLPPITYYQTPLEIKKLPNIALLALGHAGTEESYATEIREQDHLVTNMIRNRTAEGATPDEIAKDIAALSPAVGALRRYIGMAKAPTAAEILKDELADNTYSKLVVFAWHKDVVSILANELRAFGVVTVTGNTPVEERKISVDKFQSNPDVRVFIGNIAAAGVGITLTAAHNLVFVESDWTPANMAQAAMRCHRIGQDKPVTVRHFVWRGSVDESISRVLADKTTALLKVFGE